jgi:membrane protein
LRIDPLQIEPILELLIEGDWVARLDEDGVQRHVLLCDPARTSAADLVDKLLLTPDARVEAFRTRTGLARLTLEDLLR